LQTLDGDVSTQVAVGRDVDSPDAPDPKLDPDGVLRVAESIELGRVRCASGLELRDHVPLLAVQSERRVGGFHLHRVAAHPHVGRRHDGLWLVVLCWACDRRMASLQRRALLAALLLHHRLEQ